MAIIRTITRNKNRQAVKVKDEQAEEMGLRKRDPMDWDLAWGEVEGGVNGGAGIPAFAIYVLDDGEYFDPQTSTKGRHKMFGPGVVTRQVRPGDVQTHESHVNDPTVWQWVSRCIAEEFLTKDTIIGPADERKVTFGTLRSASES